MAIQIADRMDNVWGETAFEVLSKARALEALGKSVVHLEIGEPDFPTPPHVIKAAEEALASGATHYGPSLGLPELRTAVAEYILRWRGLEVDPACVVITPGAKPVLFFTYLAVLNPGDEVLYPNPGFSIYESMAAFIGAKAVAMPLREERGFSFDPDEFRSLVTDRTRLIVLNSPQNPTGGALSLEDLQIVADVARERGILVLSDEVYSRLLYRGEHYSIASLPEMLQRTVLLDGWSKTYAMTGWRIGFGVFPREMVPHIDRLIANSVSCTASFTQLAAKAALEGPQDAVDAMLAEFERRRDAMVSGLNQIPGVSCLSPGGAFYAFPNITGTGFSSRDLADRLLSDAGVAALPGTAFGRFGEGYLRFSYANSLANIQLALDRFRALLANG